MRFSYKKHSERTSELIVRPNLLRTFKAMNVKVNLPCARHEGVERVEVQRHTFLSSTLDKDDWSASHSSSLTSEETTRGTCRVEYG